MLSMCAAHEKEQAHSNAYMQWQIVMCVCVSPSMQASVLMTSLPTPPAQAAPSVPSVHTHDVSAQQHNTHNTAHMVAVLVTKQESAPAAHTKASGLPKREGVPAQASVGLWGWLTSWAA